MGRAKSTGTRTNPYIPVFGASAHTETPWRVTRPLAHKKCNSSCKSFSKRDMWFESIIQHVHVSALTSARSGHECKLLPQLGTTCILVERCTKRSVPALLHPVPFAVRSLARRAGAGPCRGSRSRVAQCCAAGCWHHPVASFRLRTLYGHSML